MLVAPALADAGLFPGLRELVTPEGEEAAANALRVNDVVLLGAGFPRTIEMLTAEGYAVVPLDVGRDRQDRRGPVVHVAALARAD